MCRYAELRQQQEQEAQEACTFSPTINPTSRKLAARTRGMPVPLLGGDLGGSATGGRPSSVPAADARRQHTLCAPGWEAGAESDNTCAAIYLRQSAWVLHNKQRCEARHTCWLGLELAAEVHPGMLLATAPRRLCPLWRRYADQRREQEQAALQECTFSPRIDPHSSRLLAAGVMYPTRGTAPAPGALAGVTAGAGQGRPGEDAAGQGTDDVVGTAGMDDIGAVDEFPTSLEELAAVCSASISEEGQQAQSAEDAGAAAAATAAVVVSATAGQQPTRAGSGKNKRGAQAAAGGGSGVWPTVRELFTRADSRGSGSGEGNRLGIRPLAPVKTGKEDGKEAALEHLLAGIAASVGGGSAALGEGSSPAAGGGGTHRASGGSGGSANAQRACLRLHEHALDMQQRQKAHKAKLQQVGGV